MAPLVNAPAVYNAPQACASALEMMQEQLDDARRVSYILGALLGIVFLLLLGSPLIFNLPKERTNHYTSRAPPHLDDEGIQMQSFESREATNSDFIIDSDEEDEPRHTNQVSHSTLPDRSRFRTVQVDGETFHVANSDATLLAETGVFRGAGDEQQLAQGCVGEDLTPSAASVHVPRARSDSAVSESGHEATPSERIGTAVSV